MGTQDDNNKGAKSKIEQLRIDLEKKLASIENSKVESNDLETVKVSEIEKDINEVSDDSNPVFEISEPIVPVVEEEEVEVKTPIIANNETIENKVVSNKTHPVTPIKVESKVVTPKQTDDKKDIKVVVPPVIKKTPETSTISQPPKTVISSIKTASNDGDNLSDENNVEPEEKKRKIGFLGYLIYGLLIALFLTIGYMFIDYMKERNNLNQERIDQKLSEYKNKRYLDSIELANLNNQLEDYQTKKMLDSVDRVYEQELITKSKFKNKKEIQRNFDIAAAEAKKKAKLAKANNNIVSNNTQGTTQNNINNNSELTKDETNTVATTTNDTNGKESTDIVSDSSNKEIENKEGNTDHVTTEAKNTESTESKPEVKKHIVKSPIYPGCERKKTELDIKRCFTSKMYKHISRSFNSQIAQNIGLKEGIHKIRVHFIVDKAGYATVLNVRGSENKKLEEEAIRVIQSLPKMNPKTIDGKRTKAEYNINVSYSVQE